MQVDWSTVEAVARTRAIDMWLLFPLGIGVNRLATRSGDIPIGWREALTRLFGTTDWEERFYRTETVPDLFDGERERIVKASQDVIGSFFVERLRSIFAAVLDPPLVLRNSLQNPLYLLCFAAGNEKGGAIALKIARHLVRNL